LIACSALRLRWAHDARPIRHRWCCFPREGLSPSTRTASAPTKGDFGAQLHGLRSRCLRFAEPVTLPAQDSLPAGGQPSPDGIEYPLGPIRRFPRFSLLLRRFPLLQAWPGAPWLPYSSIFDDHKKVVTLQLRCLVAGKQRKDLQAALAASTEQLTAIAA